MPGPRAPATLQTLEWIVRSPLSILGDHGRRHGDPFRLTLFGPASRRDATRLPLARRTLVVVSGPDSLREVFALSRDALRPGEVYEFIDWYLGPNTILTLDGEPHYEERRVLHSLLGPDHLPGHERAMRAATVQALADWPEQGIVPLSRWIQEVALDGVLSAVFGALEPGALGRLRRLVHSGATASSVPPIMMVLPVLRADLGPLSPARRVRTVRAEFAAFVDRRAASRSDSDSDMLALLIAADDRPDAPGARARLLGRIGSLLGAFETVCPATAWCCHHLFQDQEVLLRAQASAVAARDGDRDAIAYLEAVCHESLRLSPPFQGALRRVAIPVVVGGYALEPGTLVLPCSYLAHRNPASFPEPQRFRPERFLEKPSAPSAYVPFGGGVRRCIGAALALRQMRIILEELLIRFEVRPARRWSSADRRQNVLIVPRDPLPAAIRRRNGMPS